MKKQSYEVLVQFLNRVQLQGNEVPSFNQLMGEIQADYSSLPQEPEAVKEKK